MESAHSRSDGELFTPEEFRRLPDEVGRTELVRGRVVRDPPPGARHGETGLRLLLPLEVWLLHPRSRSVTVYRGPSDLALLAVGDVLEGGGVAPGFRIPAAELFA